MDMTTTPHPLCVLLRELRQATGLSLGRFQEKYGVSGVVLGSYERGDRIPPVPKLDEILAHLGYRLTVVPIDYTEVRRFDEIVDDLRSIANQLETIDGLRSLSESTPQS